MGPASGSDTGRDRAVDLKDRVGDVGTLESSLVKLNGTLGQDNFADHPLERDIGQAELRRVADGTTADV